MRNTDDLGTLVMRALAVQPAADAAASAARYGGAEIRASEQQREQQRQDRLAELRRQFVDGPVLVMPGNGSAGSNSTGRGGDSRRRDRVFRRLQGVRPVGDARCGERRAGCDRWPLPSCVGTRRDVMT